MLLKCSTFLGICWGRKKTKKNVTMQGIKKMNMFTKNTGVLATAFAVAAMSVVAVDAATTTDTFTAQIIIQDDCEITATTNLDFGTAGVITSDIDATSDLDVQCTSGTTYTIDLAGSGTMDSGPNSVTYAMYSDAGRTTVWSAVAGTGNGADQNYTVYGRVPVQAAPPAGTYTDTVTVTVTF